MIDILLINPTNAVGNYQGLAKNYAAVEPPTWALILAESVRSNAAKVAILDCVAEQLTDAEVWERVLELNPRLLCFVVYGQNVNAGTANMSGAVRTANFIKSKTGDLLIGVIGSHVQALPVETLERELSIDFAFLNEGVIALSEVCQLPYINIDALLKVRGLCVRTEGGPVFTGAPSVVDQGSMEKMMPGYAWDLLPMKSRPLDLYRSPMWHADYQDEFRSPYAAIQTSIGCSFKCSFCMINLVNRDDIAEQGVARNYSGMRFWPREFVRKQFEKLINLDVRTIRITDEMFLLNKKYYLPICEDLAVLNDNDNLRIWAYSRIDTVPTSDILKLLRRAGFMWLCLGIESGNKKIRLEIAKGKFEEVDVRQVIERIEAAGINVIANYIYGLPGDTRETIEETFKLGLELNTAGWNTYAAMALPGSALYQEAKQKGISLPDSYEGYSFHSYETLPLPTETLSAAEVLELRDQKFHEYFENKNVLAMIGSKFGRQAVENIQEMTKTRLRRKIIEDSAAN